MISAYLADVCLLALLAALPGPDVAVVTRFALSCGRPAATRAALGVVGGLAFWGALTVAGLAGLLAASADVYTALRLLGAAYLVFLGIRILRQSDGSARPTRLSGTGSEGAPLGAGALTNVLNPKIAVFYTSVLPTLVPHGASPHVWMPVLVLTHAALSMAVLSAYALAVSRSRSVLGGSRARRVLDRVTGFVLVGFGMRVAIEAG